MNANDAPASASGEVDAAEAFERLRRWGGEALVRQIVHLILTDVPHRMKGVREAVHSKDSGRVRDLAHSLKSSCAQVGARRMEVLCARLERRAEEGEIGAAPALLTELEDEHARFSAWLDDEGYGSEEER